MARGDCATRMVAAAPGPLRPSAGRRHKVRHVLSAIIVGVAWACSSTVHTPSSQAHQRSEAWASRCGMLAYRASSRDLQHIDDVAADSFGYVYALDSRLKRISAFDQRGRLSQCVGGPGRNRGEYALPSAIATTSRGDLLVIDPRARRLTAYRRIDTLSLDAVYPLAYDAWDLCTLSDRIFVLGLSGGLLVHEYRRVGDSLRIIAEFAAPFSDHPVLKRTLSKGHLACVPSSGTVLLAPPVLPEIRAYDTLGTILWRARLPGYISPSFQANGARGVTMRARSAFLPQYHLTLSTMALAGDTAAMTVGLVRRDAETGSFRVFSAETRLLSARTGQQLGSAGCGLTFGAAWRGRVFGYANEPEPLVAAVYEAMLTAP
jgi:hypothetical protein